MYSDTVTVDKAYLEILGKTKTEFDREQEEWREELRRIEGDRSNMKEYIKILNKFKESPLSVLENEKDKVKLISAINKSIKLLYKADSKNKAKTYY